MLGGTVQRGRRSRPEPGCPGPAVALMGGPVTPVHTGAPPPPRHHPSQPSLPSLLLSSSLSFIN